MSDPPIISLDTETTGAVERSYDGRRLPQQTTFNPHKLTATDGVRPRDRLIIATVTVPTQDPRSPGAGWDLDALANLEPGPSFVFRMWRPSERRVLRRWLRHADTLLGQNLPFDLTFLLAEPDIRLDLEDERHTLIDLSVLNYLEDENRPEKSLKSLGPVLGRFSYDKEATLKSGRFPNPHWTDPKGRGLYSYGCEDTHNVILGVSELARRIQSRYGTQAPGADGPLPGFGTPGHTSKGSPYCINYYSDALWQAVALQYGGIPMSRDRLSRLEDHLVHRCNRIARRLEALGIQISGPGSATSKQALIDGSVRWLERSRHPDIREHLEYTEKQRLIKFDDHNRNLVASLLPRGHLRTKALRLCSRYLKAQKLLSSYTWPLLRHKRSNKNSRSSRLVPTHQPSVGIAYPSWYVTPGPPKDGAGDDGGTVQARMTCKNPAAQTFPAIIKACICSRFPAGYITDFDLSQIELRTSGLLSGEPSILRAYQEGRDLHLERAWAVFNDRTLTRAHNDERQTGKTINFADLFDSSAETMQHTVMRMVGLELPLSFFHNVVARRPVDRPVLVEWQRRIRHHANTHGYLELPLLGFSRGYTGGLQPIDKHQVINQPIQSLAAAVMNEIIAAVRTRIPRPWGRRPWVYLTHQVYDSAYFDVQSPDRHQELAEIVEASVRHVETKGLWARLQDLTGNQCPLVYDMAEAPS